MGRALADLDPAGVGRDLMFVHDGQFGFSLFRLVADAMVWGLGLALAAKSLAFLAALAWFFGIFAFAGQFAKGATVWVAVIFTALLPNAYGAVLSAGICRTECHPAPFRRGLGAGRARRIRGKPLWHCAPIHRGGGPASSDHGARRSCELSLPFSVGKTSAGLGYLRSVRRSRS